MGYGIHSKEPNDFKNITHVWAALRILAATDSLDEMDQGWNFPPSRGPIRDGKLEAPKSSVF